jgi:hypothetical protein
MDHTNFYGHILKLNRKTSRSMLRHQDHTITIYRTVQGSCMYDGTGQHPGQNIYHVLFVYGPSEK